MNTIRTKQVVLLVLIIAGLLAVLAGSAAAEVGPPNPPVIPPHANAFGKTYDEWAAAWWNWAGSVPAGPDHPLFADGAMDCSPGQKGKVWFLGGTFVESGTADRECDVPVGKALYFPIVNVLCSPWFGDDPDNLVGCAADPPPFPPWEDGSTHVNPLYVTIDGRDVENLQQFFTLSDVFALGPLSDSNIFGQAEGAVGEAATGGYYLMLPPLSRGDHDIAFAGEIYILDVNGERVWEFTTVITYQLHVK